VTADQAGATRDAAAGTGVVVLCAGTVKTVAIPQGEAWVVREGGPGLGVSGSGDVQSGIVAGLLARGAEPAQAAVWGAALHGRAGERLAVTAGPVGFLARQLPEELPGLLSELTR
jgi:ADP-dependent NAD(P)H-hydrate dehydratase